MYLQTGDERQWLNQKRRLLESDVGSHLATTATARTRLRAAAKVTIDEDLARRLGDVVRVAVDRLVGLLRPKLAGLAARRRRTA